MLFLGDIAVPFRAEDRVSELFPGHQDELVVANLEGPIVDHAHEYCAGSGLVNDRSVLQYLGRLGVKVVSLANNHILDFGIPLQQTTEALESSHILYCGAGDCAASAGKPAVLVEQGKQRVFLGFGWNIIGCTPAARNRAGVNALDPRNVLSAVQETRATFPDATIVLLVHWGYELEQYPLPLHRELAFAAIDAGANAIVGCHSHCLQGVEVYKQSPIVYGLGNWLIPQGVFINGRLSYPDHSLIQLAFEWQPENGDMVCQYYLYDRHEHTLSRVERVALQECERNRKNVPFAGMSSRQYVRWFQQNRIRRTFLPVYQGIDSTLMNGLRDRWMGLRDFGIELLLRSGIK